MLRLGVGSKRKCVSEPHETYEITTAPHDTLTESERLENELFGVIDQQFEQKEHFPQNHEKTLYVLDRGGEKREKRVVWQDEVEAAREINLGDGNITKKFKTGGPETSGGDPGGMYTGNRLESKLRNQFKKIHGTPSWTTREAPPAQSTILSTAGHMTQPSKALPSSKLTVSRCKNLNARKSAQCIVKSMEFHPGARVAFVSGYSKSLDIFEVDGENNKHLHRHHFANFPVECARFTRDGSEIILGSKRPHFFTFDLSQCTATKIAGIRNQPNVHFKNFVMSANGEFLGFQGQEGLFAVFSAKDKQLVKCIDHRTRINCSAFLSDTVLVTAGHGGFCTLWDVRTWKPISDFQDDGALHVTSLTHSLRHVAIGSDSGVVNIYNMDDIYRTSAKPLRAVMNLTTEIDRSTFNSTGELLAISSKEVKDSLRLINMHTLHCVPNWPTANTPLANVTSVSFSPNSGYIGIGNNKGKALLYKLTHYEDY